MQQHADVRRAMLAGITALQDSEARDSRRALLPKNVGQSWSEDEKQRLIEAFKSGDSTSVIAERHGRTVRAI